MIWSADKRGGSNEVTVYLLRPAAWQPLLDAALTASPLKLRDAEARLAQSIVEALHARHVGIPPAAAASLAVALLRENYRIESYAQPWRAVMRGLSAATAELTVGQRAQSGVAGSIAPVRLDASIPYTIYHIVAPLVEAACRSDGVAYLFSEDEEADDIAAEAYDEHAAAVGRAIEKLAAYEREGENALFWEERALGLVDLSLARPSRTPGKEDAAPQADPQELALLQRLKPDPDQGRPRPPQLVLLRKPREAQDRRLRDAGVRGVTVTRRPEEIQRRLISELLYPDMIELDRLLNSGYWITDRPPRPQEMRDALVAAIYPGPANGLRRPADDAFARATWFEFAGYISGMLQASGLSQTELRWIDGDIARRWRSLSLLLRRLPDLSAASRRYEAYRDLFRINSGWLPHLLDSRARYQEPLPMRLQAVDDALLTFGEWPARVWQSQRECVGWKPDRTAEKNGALELRHNARATAYTAEPLDLDRFLVTHVMLLLPERLRATDDGRAASNLYSQRQALLQLFRLDRPGRSISITWIPDDPAGKWDFEGHAQLSRREITPADEARGTQRAADLIRLWTQNLALEMANG